MTNNKDTQSNHVTPIDGNIFLDLGFSREEAEELIKKADMIVHDTPNETVYAIYNHDLHNGMKAIRDYLNGTS